MISFPTKIRAIFLVGYRIYSHTIYVNNFLFPFVYVNIITTISLCQYLFLTMHNFIFSFFANSSCFSYFLRKFRGHETGKYKFFQFHGLCPSYFPIWVQAQDSSFALLPLSIIFPVAAIWFLTSPFPASAHGRCPSMRAAILSLPQHRAALPHIWEALR